MDGPLVSSSYYIIVKQIEFSCRDILCENFDLAIQGSVVWKQGRDIQYPVMKGRK